MEHLIEFTADREAAESYKQQHDKWLQSCHKRKAELATEFPVIQKLDGALQDLKNSCYEEEFKRGVAEWIENASMHLYSGNTKFSDKEVNAFIKNFEWYDNVIRMLLTNQEILQRDVFGLKYPENKKFAPVIADVNLITDILDLCRKTFGQTIEKDNEYRKRLDAFKRLQKAHKQFMKATSEYIDDLSRWGVNHLAYLMHEVEPTLSNMMKNFEADVANSKPIVPSYYSQKHDDLNKMLAIAVIKMMHSYMEEHYKLKNAKTDKFRMVIPKYYNVLIALGNSLLKELGEEDYEYFTKDRIKGFL